MNSITRFITITSPSLIFAMGGLFLALLLIIFHNAFENRIRGLLHIALANIIISLALVGLVYIGSDYEVIGNLVLYPLLLIGISYIGVGYRCFFNELFEIKSTWFFLPAFGTIIFEIVFLSFSVSQGWNQALLSWMSAILFLSNGIFIIREGLVYKRQNLKALILNQRVLSNFIGIVCLLVACIYFVRGLSLITSLTFLKLFSESYTVILFVMTIAGILFSFGILLLSVLRLQGELASRELRLTQNQYDQLVRTIIDIVPQAIILKDRQSIYLFVNSYFAMLHNKKPEEFVGLTDADLYPSELAQKYRADDRDVIESGLSRSFIEEHVQGDERSWVETIKTPVRDASGTVTGVLVMFIDITGRIRTQEALKESEQKYRELSEQLEKRVEERSRVLREAKRDLDLFFEVTLDYLCIINMNGYFQKVSKSWVIDTGWPEHELVGVSVLQFVFQDDRERLIEASKLLLSGVPLKDFHVRFRRADGSWMMIALSAVGVPDRNLVIAAGHDITRQLEIEERLRQARIDAEQASKAKSLFIATMSHELRTPLNAVLGYSSLLQPYIQDEKGLRYLTSINTAGRSLLAIINDILDLTKAESGRIELVPIPFEIRQLAGELLDIFRFNAEEKGLVVQIQITEAVPKTIMLDQNRLRQVLVNLLGNAIKFTDAGSVSLFIDAKPEGSQNREIHGLTRYHLCIEITDTGIGISEEFRARLFDPFSQQDFKIARKYGGTGLGLAISKRLLDLMGGTIRCEAPEQGGTRFRIDIPQVPATGNDVQYFVTFGHGFEEKIKQQSELIPVVQHEDASLTLLLVGSSEDRLRWFRELLKEKQVNIFEATLDVAQTYPIQQVHGIIFDVPADQKQLDASRELINKWVQVYKTPLLVVIPAKQVEVDRENLLSILSIGGLDYVQEPIDPEEFWLRLMNQIELKTSRTRIAAVNRALSETTSRLQQLSVQVDKLISIDDLTGLANRKTLWYWLIKEIGRCKTHRLSLALMLGDIDHLKQVNDRYGQVLGDQAVTECAHRFARALDKKVLLGRWSGEEFLAILSGEPGVDPETHLAFTQQQAEAVRNQILEEPLVIGRERIQLSISIGICLVVCDDTTSDEESLASALLRTLDDALYRAKTKGRNHVESLRFMYQSEQPVPPTEGFSHQ
ncbi:diguanylate cyclase [Gracilinema caldarium]|uniref:histidine kinase n=1 Tax=Gracilinema caldarium (strain ATCC 51460 / DSM 7334 / H1) TaxID=744872 RepID=F8EZM9_GRAC1|nr:diguanylate cyclase [Gracilinema caldarium]AEJ20753.1 diguanylate cyclase with PAS/PAC sensor [Gracilinema caldarium DSM 7334]